MWIVYKLNYTSTTLGYNVKEKLHLGVSEEKTSEHRWSISSRNPVYSKCRTQYRSKRTLENAQIQNQNSRSPHVNT
jgi:hypothetical protein